jgi:hypothetical protein
MEGVQPQGTLLGPAVVASCLCANNMNIILYLHSNIRARKVQKPCPFFFPLRPLTLKPLTKLELGLFFWDVHVPITYHNIKKKTHTETLISMGSYGVDVLGPTG